MKKQNIIVTFIIPIIAIIALLAVQALCDLELPSYTSDIINNGIQQGGIDRGLPEALTVDMFDAIVRISDEDPAIMVSYDLYVTENYKNATLITHKKYLSAVEDVKSEKADCIIMDQLPALEIVKENPELKVMDGILFQDKYGMIVKKGNDSLRKEINRVLQKLNEEGTIEKLILKHSN